MVSASWVHRWVSLVTTSSSSLSCPLLGQVGKYWKFNCVVSNFVKLAPLSVGYLKTVSELGFCVDESFAQVRHRALPQTSTSSLRGRHPPPPPTLERRFVHMQLRQ